MGRLLVKADGERKLKLKQELDSVEIRQAQDLADHENKMRELRLAEQAKKQELLEPEGKKEMGVSWAAFGSTDTWAGESTKFAESDVVITYKDLKDKHSIVEHVEEAFRELPKNALKALVDMVDSVVKVVTACEAVTDMAKANRLESGFNITTKIGERNMRTRIAYAFSFNRVTETKAQKAG